MIYPADFVLGIERQKYPEIDTKILARIALNALVDSEQFPVDIAEVRALGVDASLAARAFLAYMATNPEEFSTWSAQRCGNLRTLAQSSSHHEFQKG